MPELPEVETIRIRLDTVLKGKTVRSVKILSKKQFPQSVSLVVGEKIIKVERRAKLLILRLTHKKNLMIHLKLNGQLIWIRNGVTGDKVLLKRSVPTIGSFLPAKSTRVILGIGRGRLFFNEMRKFGWIKLVKDDELQRELSKYGVEPLTNDFSASYLENICRNSQRAIKLVLLDQEKIAGIGNIYASESLFLSKINPAISADKLTLNRIRGLRGNIVKVLKLGLKYGGTSEEYYLRPDMTTGNYQKHFLVYGRTGDKCKKCGSLIKRISLGGRGTFFCPKCQKS